MFYFIKHNLIHLLLQKSSSVVFSYLYRRTGSKSEVRFNNFIILKIFMYMFLFILSTLKAFR